MTWADNMKSRESSPRSEYRPGNSELAASLSQSVKINANCQQQLQTGSISKADTNKAADNFTVEHQTACEFGSGNIVASGMVRREYRRSSNPRKPREQKNLYRKLNEAANAGDIATTLECFKKIDEEHAGLTVVTMNILIKGYCRANKSSKGLELLRSMLNGQPEGYGVLPNEGTFCAVVDGLASSGDLASAWMVLSWQRSFGFFFQTSFCKILRNTLPKNVLTTLLQAIHSWNIVMDTSISSAAVVALIGHGSLARGSAVTPMAKEPFRKVDMMELERVELFCESMGTCFTVQSCTKVISALNKQERFKEAISFSRRYMSKPNFYPDQKFFSCTLDSLVLHIPPMTNSAENLIREMRTQYNMEPDVGVINNLMKGYGRFSPPDVDRALELFYSVANPRDCDYGSRDIKPTSYTFAIIANVLCSVGRAVEAEAIIRKMERFGLKPLAIHYNILLKGFARCRCKIRSGRCKCVVCFCSDPEHSLNLLEEMEPRGLEIDMHAVLCIIDSFCSSAQVDKARSIVDRLLKNNANKDLRPNISVYNRILRGISLKYFSSQNLKVCSNEYRSPSDIQAAVIEKKVIAFAEIDELLTELKSLSLKPNDVTHNTILGIFCDFESYHISQNYLFSHLHEYYYGDNVVQGFNIILKGLSLYARRRKAQQEDITFEVAKEVNEIVDHMYKKLAFPDVCTLNSIVMIYAGIGMMAKAESIVEEMVRLDEKRKNQARGECGQEYFQYPSKSSTLGPDVATFSTLVKGYLSMPSKAKAKEDALRIIKVAESVYNLHLPQSIKDSVSVNDEGRNRQELYNCNVHEFANLQQNSQR